VPRLVIFVPNHNEETMIAMKTIALFDRGAAAYALCVGIPLVRVLAGTWQAYEFDDSEGLASAALATWKTGTGCQVNARAYWNSFKTLRNANTNTINDGEKVHDAIQPAPTAR
jgi:hypothetical protein